MPKFPIHIFWKIFKIIMIIQVFNAVMSASMWLSYGYLFPIWKIAALTVFCTLLIFATKVAVERERTANPIQQ